MARYLSVYRRRTNLVDLFLNVRPNAAFYTFKAADNFDAAFTAFQDVPAAGFRSPSVIDTGFTDSQFRGKTRFIFNPTDYTPTVAAVDDTKPFYVLISQVDVDGTVHADEAMHLILPYSSQPNRPVILAGVVPIGATIANSVEIQLPMQCQNFKFQVNSGNDLMVAFEPTAPEFVVYPITTNFSTYDQTYPTFSQVFMRGDGGASTMSASFAMRNNPLY